MEKMSIKTALEELLNNLDKIAAKHPEIHDTAVREVLSWTIDKYFILPIHNFKADKAADYKMFSDEGNKEIHEALSQFLNHPDVIRARIELPSSEEREEAFDDEEVKSSEGNCYGDYFGWSDGEFTDFAE